MFLSFLYNFFCLNKMLMGLSNFQYGVNVKHQEYYADSPSTGLDPTTRDEWIWIWIGRVLRKAKDGASAVPDPASGGAELMISSPRDIFCILWDGPDHCYVYTLTDWNSELLMGSRFWLIFHGIWSSAITALCAYKCQISVFLSFFDWWSDHEKKNHNVVQC